jgi:hypothetical protein
MDVVSLAIELWSPDSDGVEAADETEEGGDGSLALGFMLTGCVKSGGFMKVPSAGESECESEKEPPEVVILLDPEGMLVVPDAEGGMAEGCSLAWDESSLSSELVGQ